MLASEFRGKRKRTLQERVWDHAKRCLFKAPKTNVYCKVRTRSSASARAAALQRRLRREGERKWEFQAALKPYEDLLESDEVGVQVHPQRGVILVAKKSIPEGQPLEAVPGVPGIKISEQRANASFSSFLVEEKCGAGVRKVHKLLFGPAALCSASCAIHANCREINNWQGLMTLNDIEEDEELLVYYGHDDFPCPIKDCCFQPQ
jgi:hypothetical protein